MSAKQKAPKTDNMKTDNGTMTATINGEQFLTSKSVYLTRGTRFTTLIGTQDDENQVILSFPNSEDLAPRVVEYPKDFIKDIGYTVWQAIRAGEPISADVGEMKLKFFNTTTNIEGSFEFQSKDGLEKVKGNFKMQR